MNRLRNVVSMKIHGNTSSQVLHESCRLSGFDAADPDLEILFKPELALKPSPVERKSPHTGECPLPFEDHHMGWSGAIQASSELFLLQLHLLP